MFNTPEQSEEQAFYEYLRRNGMERDYKEFLKDRKERDRGVAELDVLRNPNRWYDPAYDPHFSDKPAGDRCAPSPAARFPASEEGWKNALRFANTTSGSES